MQIDDHLESFIAMVQRRVPIETTLADASGNLGVFTSVSLKGGAQLLIHPVNPIRDFYCFGGSALTGVDRSMQVWSELLNSQVRENRHPVFQTGRRLLERLVESRVNYGIAINNLLKQRIAFPFHLSNFNIAGLGEVGISIALRSAFIESNLGELHSSQVFSLPYNTYLHPSEIECLPRRFVSQSRVLLGRYQAMQKYAGAFASEVCLEGAKRTSFFECAGTALSRVGFLIPVLAIGFSLLTACIDAQNGKELSHITKTLAYEVISNFLSFREVFLFQGMRYFSESEQSQRAA